MATKKPATKRVATKAPAKKTTAKVATAKSRRPAVKKNSNSTATFSLSYDGSRLKTHIEGNAELITKMLVDTIQEEPSLKVVLMAACAIA